MACIFLPAPLTESELLDSSLSQGKARMQSEGCEDDLFIVGLRNTPDGFFLGAQQQDSG